MNPVSGLTHEVVQKSEPGQLDHVIIGNLKYCSLRELGYFL